MCNGRYKFVETYIFFDGRSVLRNFQDEYNNLVTFGFMAKGKYSWLAETTEHFRIYSGEAYFNIEEKRILVRSGDEIIVPKNLTFEVEVTEHLDYRCFYD
ncbi:hypothetical protein B5C26_20410 [Photorhabdus luminescens]|uniref:pyrimidine/purine nucleoside phosphorylase n=1 Tax=Photorhabdus TaxID=29487 RepID=UPI000B4C7B63|nr:MULTISPECIES: pyrimidine/purine nucleoside phosphorylase [Photorhabdus]MCW7546730.1 pyrimidine/purine nucleoside phosphorylase [Photorhabdus aballayi]OWO79536.1 hypothetical protein B5C26_20410 [Photorhabdus luminescens]